MDHVKTQLSYFVIINLVWDNYILISKRLKKYYYKSGLSRTIWKMPTFGILPKDIVINGESCYTNEITLSTKLSCHFHYFYDWPSLPY